MNIGIVPPVAILEGTGQLEIDHLGMRDSHVAANDELLIDLGPGAEGSHINCDDGVELAQLNRELNPLTKDLLAWHVGVDGLLGQTCLVLRHGDCDGDRGCWRSVRNREGS